LRWGTQALRVSYPEWNATSVSREVFAWDDGGDVRRARFAIAQIRHNKAILSIAAVVAIRLIYPLIPGVIHKEYVVSRVVVELA
jgi:hypothetical protein